ncbi:MULTISPECIES: potassium channel family protein [unclassified Helicobacter]|uniref:potassium channel family protein n=1 Tax=unclassified Helicobacter TaxID=2593540 RepID=UPI0009EE912C|nr:MULTISPECIES: TrkA family potassium uptake protein [unclassified Helicobacter]
MKKRATYGVIGLGKFGFHVAKGLIEQGQSVIIADQEEEKVKEFASLISMAYILDSTDKDALEESGFARIDYAIVSIGEDIESSILTVMALKELEIKQIIAKAITPVHGKILAKLGANKIIYPERESAANLIKGFLSHPDFEITDISNTISIARIKISQKSSGQLISDIAKRAKAIGIKRVDSGWNLEPNS